jgi:hypothetical protein
MKNEKNKIKVSVTGAPCQSSQTKGCVDVMTNAI